MFALLWYFSYISYVEHWKCIPCLNQQINSKDSAIIEMYVKQMIKYKIDPFEYGYYDSLNIRVGQVLQSPDKLKMIVVLGVEEKFKSDASYQASSLVGVRKDRKSKWIFYEFSGVKIHWTSMQKAIDNMCCALYSDLKGQSISIPEYHFDFTPLEKGFWSSIPFQKGLDVDSLYNCQVEYDYSLGKRTKIRPFIEFNYPDSLIY